jgi:hypothetical protein
LKWARPHLGSNLLVVRHLPCVQHLPVTARGYIQLRYGTACLLSHRAKHLEPTSIIVVFSMRLTPSRMTRKDNVETNMFQVAKTKLVSVEDIRRLNYGHFAGPTEKLRLSGFGCCHRTRLRSHTDDMARLIDAPRIRCMQNTSILNDPLGQRRTRARQHSGVRASAYHIPVKVS